MNELVTEEFRIFPWNENLMTGIKEIDEQHQVIVMLINRLANNLIQEKEFEIEDTFNELANYASFHFKCEEKIWEKYLSGNDLEISHKQSHNSFLPEVLKIKEKNKNSSFTQIAEEILLFLTKWLAFHIVNEDMRLALIIKSLSKGNTVLEAVAETNDHENDSMKNLINTILSMYDHLSLKTISLIRERKARVQAENKLLEINKKLEELSITDQLTNLYNRRHFDEVFKRELKKSKRKKTALSLILIDIDYFKKINDTLGHAYGDKVLQEVARYLKETCKRPNDFVFRVGGEEFMILITDEDHNRAISLTKILQENIKNIKIPNINNNLFYSLTVSGGLVCKIPLQDDTVDSIVKIADNRLYKAKESGRNKIIIE